MEQGRLEGTASAQGPGTKLAPAVTMDKEKTPPNMPPEKPSANQTPSELQTTPAPVTQPPTRNTKEPEYLKDYVQ